MVFHVRSRLCMMRFSLMISAAVATRCFESDFEASKLQVCEGQVS